MKVALLADLHLGFGANTNRIRYEDSFRQAKEAIELAAEHADVILIAGDIFDTRRPGLEVLARSVDVFSPAKEIGIPIYAIHGNHDIRVGAEQNVVKLLDRFGILTYIHRQRVNIKINHETLEVFGVGWIPDSHAAQVFSLLPTPSKDPSILLFHQPLAGFFNWINETPIEPSMLPEGYSLYVTGHLHWHVAKNVNGRRIVIPGSTIRTQLRDKEVQDTPAFFIWDTQEDRLDEVVLKTPRKGILLEIDVTFSDHPEQLIVQTIERAIAGQNFPIVKVNVGGRSKRKINVKSIEKRFKDRALVKIVDKSEAFLAEEIQSLREAQQQQMNIVGQNYVMVKLLEFLKKSGLDVPQLERVLHLLAEEKPEQALNVLVDGKEKKEGILSWI